MLDNPKDSLKKGIKVPLAHVTNPKIKNNAPRISVGRILDLDGWDIGNFIFYIFRMRIPKRILWE